MARSLTRPPRRIGSHSLGEFRRTSSALNASAVAAPGATASKGLMARFGPDIALPDLLMELAQCERRKDFSKPCGARFTGLAGSAG
jgi:hypothetical protein